MFGSIVVNVHMAVVAAETRAKAACSSWLVAFSIALVLLASFAPTEVLGAQPTAPTPGTTSGVASSQPVGSPAVTTSAFGALNQFTSVTLAGNYVAAGVALRNRGFGS